MRRWLHDNSLSIFFLALFLASLLGQAIAGQRQFNSDQLAHEGETISFGRYLVSSDFGQAMLENWQSEFLQFSFFILATVWLVQRGSNESKQIDEAGLESDQKQKIGDYAEERSPLWAKMGGWRTAIYSHSLMIAMSAIFLAAWLTQSVTGWTQYNGEQRGSTTSQPSRGWGTWLGPTSGRTPSRTGNRSSSPWGRWPCSRSICVSADRRSRSPSARRTTRRRPPAEAPASRCGASQYRAKYLGVSAPQVSR
jgi:hypothetical protein